MAGRVDVKKIKLSFQFQFQLLAIVNLSLLFLSGIVSIRKKISGQTNLIRNIITAFGRSVSQPSSFRFSVDFSLKFFLFFFAKEIKTIEMNKK